MPSSLLDTKPIPKPLLAYRQLDPVEHMSMKILFEIKTKTIENIVC